MLDPILLWSGLINGLLQGSIYALVALGLTLIYGVLHIINFAHGSLLMLAMYGVFLLFTNFGIDPYAALPILVIGMFALGYGLQRVLIGRASHGRDENILLVTLGISIVIENLALFFFQGDTRTIDVPYAFDSIEIAGVFVAIPRLIAFGAALLIAALLWLMIQRSDVGRAIRAVAKEKQGARLVGINVDHIYAVSYGIGIACLGAAACLLMPTYLVYPTVGHAFVLIAFTVVVLGGMGSFPGALLGGLLIGLCESFGGLFLGESFGQIGIFLVFIAVLLFRPSGLLGSRV
ncbi:branched-chain amino acid ABC transporter permease [Pelagibius sp.]|uniref:branched-chain amino acid ABC transporter permease n=1 Tax=Pelagibius sp. TaxID=1931238 RepID=UPI003BB221BF